MKTDRLPNPNQHIRIPKSIAVLIATTALSACVPTGPRPSFEAEQPEVEALSDDEKAIESQNQIEFTNFIFSPERVGNLSENIDKLSEKLYENAVTNKDSILSFDIINNKRFDAVMKVQTVTSEGVPLYFEAYGVNEESEDNGSALFPFNPETLIMYAPNDKGYKYDADAGIALILSDEGEESYTTVYSQPSENADSTIYHRVDGSLYSVTTVDYTGAAVRGSYGTDIDSAIESDLTTVNKLEFFIDQIAVAE